MARLLRYGRQALRPALSADGDIVRAHAAAVLAQGTVAHGSLRLGRPDILCLANIHWRARFQRPQQLMTQFAQRGHRVFYIVPPDGSTHDRPYALQEVAENVFEVKLHVWARQDCYREVLTQASTADCQRALAALMVELQVHTAVTIVHLAYWTPLALALRHEHGWQVTYDCMDDWQGFPLIGEALLDEEKRLVAQANLVTVSATLLQQKWAGANPNCVLVRNAVDFDFFQRHCCPSDLLAELEGPILGYYGALAQWLDFALLADLARRRPEWNLVLVGDVFVDDLCGLDRLPNVHLLGHQPYAHMPLYLERFDVCLIPFRLYNVTHAVDPVKLYEYWSAGKPVVSSPLEEILRHERLLYLAEGADAFIQQVEQALEESPERRSERIDTARANDWRDRFEQARCAIGRGYPMVSIIVVSYNNLELTAACLDSLERNTSWPNCQVIVVDNASTDASPHYLARLQQRMPGLKVILNSSNRGFAAANNQGLQLADGEILVLLNNDTEVPRGWLEPLLRHLQDSSIGLVGPVTNNVGNQARVAVDYSDIAQMQEFADRYTHAHRGRCFDIAMLAMFCVALRRDVLERIGPLDEAFGIGLFEDDDYSRRVQAAGYRTVCAEDSYIHHHGQASFKALIASGEYQPLWDRNQAYFESKWGTWQAHRHRGEELPVATPPVEAEPAVTARLPRQRSAVLLLRQLYYALPLSPGARHQVGMLYRRLRPALPAQLRVQPDIAMPAHDLPGLAARQSGLPDYIIWGVIDWHFRHQRPQQLARQLAASGRRVFYISSELLEGDAPGFHIESLDQAGRLFQVRLQTRRAPIIYAAPPSTEVSRQLRASLGAMLQWADCEDVVSLVNHPFWYDIAQAVPNQRLVYDCMDDHEGFGNNAPGILALERRLTERADLTLFTSEPLQQALADRARHSCLIRNAADYAHFATPPGQPLRDSLGRRIIGYYGAIAEWFDVELLAAVARRFDDCCIRLVGADTINAAARLRHQSNIEFIGEVAYAELPQYLHGFDVCLLPFRIIPLTLATNPVKVYEYLSAGKPVVSVDLPELRQFGANVEIAGDTGQFLAALSQALENPGGEQRCEQRRAFARQQTWAQRTAELVAAVESTRTDPSLSVIVVTYNNLALTQVCLASLERSYPSLQIIVVDNASSDGTAEYLQTWVTAASGRQVILNDENLGFAAANNQGLKVADGDYLLLLNNDTQVAPGALRTLLNHLQRDPRIGLIGPVTNNIGNEAKIDITYERPEDMPRAAARHTRQRCGELFPIRTLAFFCVMLPRSTYENIGALDEAFGLGFFEDDDYCRRIEQAGLSLMCAEDAFVHHQLSASFDQLKQQARQKLFERNRRIYERKWGQWTPHSYRN
ncbi:glycosyltransferase [Pseudomonas nicosulfuronedens]